MVRHVKTRQVGGRLTVMPDLPTELMATQHGLATTAQLQAEGLSAYQVRRLIDGGVLIRLSPRIVRVAGARQTLAQRLLAAVLDAGPSAALSHTSALAWWGLPGFLYDVIHVTHTRDKVYRRSPLADHVHDVVLLPEHHLLKLEDVPTVCPARALFDIAGLRRVHPRRVERAVDNAWSRRLVSGFTLQTMLDELAERGRPGITVMRSILDERGPGYVPPASGLEGRVVQILKEAGQPPLLRQVDCGDDRGWIGRVDFKDPELPFILEVQSERFHASLLDQEADSQRFARLQAAGYIVTTVTDTDVWHRPRHVVVTVQTGRLQARYRSCPV